MALAANQTGGFVNDLIKLFPATTEKMGVIAQDEQAVEELKSANPNLERQLSSLYATDQPEADERSRTIKKKALLEYFAMKVESVFRGAKARIDAKENALPDRRN